MPCDSREGFIAEQREYPPRTKAGAIAAGLVVPEAELGTIMVNSRDLKFDRLLAVMGTLVLIPLVG